MNISEIFCSINGESCRSGLRTVFIRTFGCPLRCSYCDSMYSVEGADYKSMSVAEIIEAVDKYNAHYVTLTGGEPLIQKDVIDLIKELDSYGYEIEIETSGAVDLKPIKDLKICNCIITMDWKCPSSGMTSKMLESNLGLLDYDDVLKFVVGSEEDLQEVLKIREKTCSNIYVSPVFGKIELKDIADFIINEGLNDVRLQLQLHKVVWDPNLRGV